MATDCLWNPVAEVEAAAAILDKRKRKWYEKIDLGRLDMMYPGKSILGQLYGRHELGIYALLKAGEPPAISNAFIPPWWWKGIRVEAFRWLTELWKIEVEKRT